MRNKSISQITGNRWADWETAILNRLRSELNVINGADKPKLAKIQDQLSLSRKVMTELREEVLSQEFSDQQEEMYFMKKLKPAFLSLQLYYGELLLLESNKPKGTARQLL